jgi:putative transposase
MPAARRNAIWETDHKQLGVKVIPPQGSNPVVPWITTFMDAKHRLIVGVSVSMQPTTGDVLAAFRTGVRRDPDLSPAYGAPDELHYDNGKEFLSDALTEVVVTMGVLPRALQAYAPHLKGKIERWHRTLDDEFLATLPQFQGGPRAANDRLYGSSSAFLSYELLCQELLAWIRHYNYERPHSELHGLTPAQSWEQDPAMLREFSEDELRWMSLPSAQRTVNQDGIRHENRSYVASELTALRGEKVEIRYMPHDHRSVDVYRDRKFICTAFVTDAISAEEQQRLMQDRKRQARKASRLRGKASQQAKVRLASVTGASDPTDEQITVITREQVDAQGGLHTDADHAPAGPVAAPAGLNRPWTPAAPSSTDNTTGNTKVSSKSRNAK